MKKTTRRPAEISLVQREKILAVMKERFAKNMARHPGIAWTKVQTRLTAAPKKLWSLNEMEQTGGEPDVIGQDQKTGEYLIADCAAESPKGRRSLCYDAAAYAARKEFKPKNNAVGLAAAMGLELMDEEQYRALQQLGNFDTKSSSWMKTPVAIRQRGGAIFGDRRYDHVFIYHNGAESYYASRGFRGSLKV